MQYLPHTCLLQHQLRPSLHQARRIHCNSMLNTETLQGSAQITYPADISHYFTPNLDKELEGDAEAEMLCFFPSKPSNRFHRRALPQQEQ